MHTVDRRGIKPFEDSTDSDQTVQMQGLIHLLVARQIITLPLLILRLLYHLGKGNNSFVKEVNYMELSSLALSLPSKRKAG